MSRNEADRRISNLANAPKCLEMKALDKKTSHPDFLR